VLDGLGVDGGGEGDGGDNDGEPHEIGGAAQAQRFDLGAVQADGGGGLLRVVVAVQGEVAGQQHGVDEQPFGQQVEGPGEGHAAQEAEEEGRVAQRGEQAAAVGDDEDGEQHRVDPVAALGIGIEQRADEQHGGAGGAHEAGQHGAHGQEGGVAARGGLDVALEEDAAGDDEQGQEQGDELPVFDDGGENGLPSQDQPHPHGHGRAQDQGDGELAGPPLPPVGGGGHERQDGNTGEHRREGQNGPPLQLHGELLESLES